MKNEDSNTPSLESVRFIIQHPWAFIYPVIIIMSIVLAFISALPLTYECKAIISFKSFGSELISAKFIEKRQDLVSRILIGENIRNIIKEVWPQVREDANPAQYNLLIEKLRNPKSGIKMWYDKEDVKSDEKGPKEFLNIAFADSSPNICYKVVGATIETIKKSNKDKTEQEMESGLVFLKKQIEFYMDKLKAIDEETSRIRTELKQKYPYLSEEEKSLIDETIGTTSMDIKTQAKTQQLADYDQKLTELNLQLVELERTKEELQNRLDKGDITPTLLSDKDLEEDTFIKGYSAAIADKELAAAGLMSQGFMPEHPQIKNIKREIENLKILREQRIEELLKSPAVSSTVKIARTEGVRNELKSVEAHIETVNIKVKTLQEYIQTSENKLKPGLTGVTGISGQTLKLVKLKNEKEINQRYYDDIRQQLELAEIKNRLQKEDAGLKIDVVEEPKVPIKPIPMQKIKFLVIGLMVSAASGVGLSYAVDSMDNSIKSSSELRKFLQVPVIASIDQINTRQDINLQQVRRHALAMGLLSAVLASYFISRFVLKLFLK